jgi:hypothetical protein
MYDFVTNDTVSKLKVTCVKRSDGTPVDLTGSTINLKFRCGPGAIITRAMGVTSAVNGQAEYTFAVGELQADDLTGEVEITTAGGFIMSSLTFVKHRVRPKLV